MAELLDRLRKQDARESERASRQSRRAVARAYYSGLESGRGGPIGTVTPQDLASSDPHLRRALTDLIKRGLLAVVGSQPGQPVITPDPAGDALLPYPPPPKI